MVKRLRIHPSRPDARLVQPLEEPLAPGRLDEHGQARVGHQQPPDVGALLAVVPFTDALPDRWEGPLVAIIAVAVVSAVFGLAVRRVRRRPEHAQESMY